MNASARSENSTNVRPSSPKRRPRRLGVTAARVGLRMLSGASPFLAAAAAERLLLTAPRHKRPAAEAEALGRAEAFVIPHAGSHLPAWRWGRGERTVLLVHGWEGRGSQLLAFVDPLVAAGFTVVTFDAPGHGDAPTHTASIVEHSRAVRSAGAFLGPLHGIVAHSVGGAATLYATRHGLAVDRLALLAPPVDPRLFTAGFARVLALTDEVRDGMIERFETRYGVSLGDLDVSDDAARTACPVLVVHDEQDRVVPLAAGAAIAERAPRGRLVTTHGLGHDRVLRAPEVVSEVVPFLTEGLAPSPSAASFAATIDGELFFRERRWG
ncbi:MAG: hypothetical protein JWP97_3444 [Labilithrix sp.]|nr:hypothetical protein [Labilithrix sp.]